MKPLLVDLFCGAGGASMGYHQAGFDVIGVDLAPQPNYPFEFRNRDALAFADWLATDKAKLLRVAAVHASPPCQRYSDLAHRNGNGDDWPDLIGPVRDTLDALGLPYVIENVEGAPLLDPVTLCGVMFPGLRVIRHRLFELGGWTINDTPQHGPHPLVFTHDKRKSHYGRLDQDTAFVTVTGGGNATLANKLDAMGIDWMRSHHEVNEAIPPAYTRWIGERLLEVVA